MSLKTLYDVPAPAKINLFLHVVGRRPDGYHLLQSVFVLIDWADTLHFEVRSDGQLSREDLGPALPEDDLSLRAARTLQRASGTRLGAHLQVDKQVPWGAGLGGGSSDAASTLLALNRLWGLNWPRAELQKLALPLGADVPFFLGGHNAWVEGIGEELTPIALPPMRLALLKPAIAVPTSAIFGSPLLRRDSPRHTIAVFLADELQAKQTVALGSQFEWFGRNDLQPCAAAYSREQAMQSNPTNVRASQDAIVGDIDEALSLMARSFGNSRMSGSGSTVFSLLPDDISEKTASAADGTMSCSSRFEHLLATVPQNWTGRMCHSLTSHPLVSWATD